MASSADAEIILKLYELRTEPEMRAARKFVSSLAAASFDEIAEIHRDAGSQNNAYWRQVLTYWEMAAALVLNDALDPDLFCDTNGEPFFYYAKFTPFLAEWRETFGAPLMRLTGKMIETYPAMQAKYSVMLARVEAGRKARVL